MSIGPGHAKRIKGILLTIGVLILACILTLFIFRRQQNDSPAQPDISPEERSATISGTGMVLTVIQNETKKLLLEAENTIIYDENISKLYDLKATFYNEKGEPAYLTAESGILTGDIEGDSFDLEVSGDVVLKNEQCEVRTETITYNSEARDFVAQSPPVVIISTGITQRADWMIYHLDSMEIDFSNVNSNVKGKF